MIDVLNRNVFSRTPLKISIIYYLKKIIKLVGGTQSAPTRLDFKYWILDNVTGKF